jgi:hypothetical protein
MRFTNYLHQDRLLTEGMIKVPTSMFAEGKKLIAQEALGYIITTCEAAKTDHGQELADHGYKLLGKLDVEYKPGKKKELSIFKMKMELDELPQSYQKIVTSHGGIGNPNLKLELDWGASVRLGRDNDGSYRQMTAKSVGIIVLGIRKLVDQPWRSWAKTEDSKGIEVMDRELEAIFDAYEHELTHFVQSKILMLVASNDDDANDKAFKAASGSSREAYLTSDIEFDPTIKSEAGRFKRGAKENEDLGFKAGSTQDWFKIFIGEKKVKMLGDLSPAGMIAPSKFFLTLKSHDMTKWKKAVKLITTRLGL